MADDKKPAEVKPEKPVRPPVDSALISYTERELPPKERKIKEEKSK